MKKMKLSELKRPEFVVKDFEHPVHGKLEGWVKMKGSDTNEYFMKAVELSELEDPDTETLLIKNAELLATLVTDWDQEFFEMECTNENVVTVFSQISNVWLRNLLFKEVDKQNDFFTKKEQNVKKQ